MSKLYYDLETEGLPPDQLEKLMPEFEAGKNLKDPEKIKADIEAKKAEWLDKAALKAITGKIVAVSYAWDRQEPTVSYKGTEKELINEMVKLLMGAITTDATAYAWNGHGFDLPFLCQRAAVHDIPAFLHLTTRFKGRFRWSERFVDPKLVWSNYSPDHTGTSLKSVALALGVGEKTGSGKDFAETLKTDPAKAIEYARLDVELLRKIVNRMGI